MNDSARSDSLKFIYSPKSCVPKRKSFSAHFSHMENFVANLSPAGKGSGQLVGDVDLRLLRLQHRAGDVRRVWAVGDQTGGHSLPRREGAAGSQCMNLDTLLGAHNVDGADGGCLGRDVGNVAGLAEGAVQRVLQDGHGTQLHDLCGLAQPFLNVTAADELGDRVNECNVARPAGAGGDDVRAALGDVIDDLRIVVDVLRRGIVDVRHRHP